MTPLDLVEDSLATYRLTRLVTKDRIARPLRRWWILDAYADEHPTPWVADTLYGRNGQRVDPEQAVRNDHDPPALAEFIICPWCIGVWAALTLGLLRWILPRPAYVALRRLLATSAVASLVATQVDE